jgi:hypothetical protein
VRCCGRCTPCDRAKRSDLHRVGPAAVAARGGRHGSPAPARDSQRGARYDWNGRVQQPTIQSAVLGWPEETQLGRLSCRRILVLGSARFSGVHATSTYLTRSMSNLWKRGIPTANEYSQLHTPQMIYLNAALFREKCRERSQSLYSVLGGRLKLQGAPSIGSAPHYSSCFQADQDLMPARRSRKQPRGPYGAASSRNGSP